MTNKDTLAEAIEIITTEAEALRACHASQIGNFYDWGDDHEAHGEYLRMLRVAAELKQMENARSHRLLKVIAKGIGMAVGAVILAAVMAVLFVAAMSDPIELDKANEQAATPAVNSK